MRPQWQARQVTSAFRGTVPTVKCRDVTGIDCDREISFDADHCGDPSHVRQEGKRSEPGSSYISNRKQRDHPTLTVREDYELFEDLERGEGRDSEADRAWPDLDAGSFDAEHLQVGIKAQKAFTAHHHVGASVAIDEIKMLAEYAMRRGKYLRHPSGFHRLEAKKFRVNVTPDGRMVTNYSTRHFERMPSQVIGGMRSRFGPEGKRRHEPGPPLSLDELRGSFDPATITVLPRAVSGFAKRMGLDKKVPETADLLRRTLGESARQGHWSVGDREGAFVVESPPWVWLIAADDGTLITVWRLDDPA
jgi:hypothetical protein